MATKKPAKKRCFLCLKYDTTKRENVPADSLQDKYFPLGPKWVCGKCLGELKKLLAMKVVD